MALTDLHTHTTFSDGCASVREMAQAAYEQGVITLGISDHSYTPFDPEYCQGMEDEGAYQQEVRAVARDFDGKVELLCSIEQDLCSGHVGEGYDYVIGSVHYVEVDPSLASKAQGHLSQDGLHGYVSVDETEEQFVAACRVCFDGDYYAFAQAYYANVARVLQKTGATIVGHFDLFAKYNRDNRYFDESDNRYIRTWQAAADAIISYAEQSEKNVRVEVNYGGVLSGYRDVPYPVQAIQEYFQERGIDLIETSDAHSCAGIACFA